jgi:hypothetical protein
VWVIYTIDFVMIIANVKIDRFSFRPNNSPILFIGIIIFVLQLNAGHGSFINHVEKIADGNSTNIIPFAFAKPNDQSSNIKQNINTGLSELPGIEVHGYPIDIP